MVEAIIIVPVSRGDSETTANKPEGGGGKGGLGTPPLDRTRSGKRVHGDAVLHRHVKGWDGGGGNRRKIRGKGSEPTRLKRRPSTPTICC